MLPNWMFKYLLAVMLVTSQILTANAQTGQRRQLPLIRDAEIEALIRDYSEPIFKVAGLSDGAAEVYLLNDRKFNAFATDKRIFINTGALLAAETPNEIIGVIAHETGHIAGRHQERLRDQLKRASVASLIGALIGAGAAAAGGSGSSSSAIILGTNQAVQRSLLRYIRSEEQSADRAALKYLKATGQSGKGMLATFKRFAREISFSANNLNPYTLTHPMPRRRIAATSELAKESPFWDRKDPASLQKRHELMRGKIAAYTGGLGAVRRAFRDNLNSIGARYGLAISTFLYGQPRKALPMVDRLIKKLPNNPYLYEMKGEIYLRSAMVGQAVAPLRRAVKLDRGKTGLLRIELGHALLETGDPKLLGEAVKELKIGLHRDRHSPQGFLYLSRAYQKQQKIGLALAASAEGMFAAGNLPEAKRFASRAQVKLKRGSREWVRAQEIIEYNNPL